MGNWRTVDIKGYMDKIEASELRKELSEKTEWDSPAACLRMSKSLCGLNQWVDEDGIIDSVGNLAERDYDNDDIERALTYIVEKYPSLELTLHSGSDWESLVCSATFHVKDGIVKRSEPKVDTIREINKGLIGARLYAMLSEG